QQTGVPAIFPRQYFFELSQPCRKNTSQNRSKNSGGAKQLLKRHQHNVITVPMTNAAADLDTPEQLAQLSNDPFYQASICGEPQ
ncbi:MAG: CTP:molybdopterin cytidylyltransferase MocA, partial [Phenylobacterium sp.]